MEQKLQQVAKVVVEVGRETEAAFFAEEASLRVLTMAAKQMREKKNKYLEKKKIRVGEWWSEKKWVSTLKKIKNKNKMGK